MEISGYHWGKRSGGAAPSVLMSRTAPAPDREAAFHIVVVVANKPGG
jgi:hypothetical protein